MPIVFACTCGSTLKAKEPDAGKRTKCPKCGKVVAIPGGGAKVAAGVGNPISDPNAIAVDMTWPTQEIGASPQSEAAPLRETAPGTQGESTTIQFDASVADRVEHDPLDDARPTDGTRQYKVLQPKDYGLTGKFNATKLEEALNKLAHKGWNVKSSVVVRVHSHSGDHDELIVVMER